MLQLLKPKGSRTHAPQQEKPLWWEACTLQREISPYLPQRKARTATKTQQSQNKTKQNKKNRYASSLTVKKNKIQLCLQWAASLTGPGNPLRSFALSASHQAVYSFFIWASFSPPAVTPQTKEPKEEVTSPVFLVSCNFVDYVRYHREEQPHRRTSGGLAAPGPPRWCSPLAPSDSRPGTWPERGDRITQSSLTVTTRTFKCCHHPRTLVLG